MSKITNISSGQKEMILLAIVSEAGGVIDAGEYSGNPLNWFCNDETPGDEADTFNRCINKHWLSCSHSSDDDSAIARITGAGRAALSLARGEGS